LTSIKNSPHRKQITVLALSPCKFNQTGTDLIEDQSQRNSFASIFLTSQIINAQQMPSDFT